MPNTAATATKRPAKARAATPRKAAADKPSKPRRLSVVIRVSRRNGRDGDGFMAPDQQRDVIDQWAERHGVEIRDEWVHDETDSVSGRTTQREGLQAAMRQALSGETDGIIVAKVDRFSRNLSEGLTAVRELHEAGKVFVAVNDGIDGSNPKNLGAKVLLTVMLLFAEWYLESITAGWEDTQKRRIAKGVAGIPPYGYVRASKDDGRCLVPDKLQAKVVERIFTERAAGKSLQQVADGLNADGIVPPRRAPRRDGQPNRDAVQWIALHVSRVASNRVYLGELTHGENVNKAAHDPIVKPDLFDRANTVRKTPVRRAEGVFLLAGIVRCASCGARMSGATSTANPQRATPYATRFYRCRANFRWGTCAAPARIKAADLEAVVVAEFLDRFTRRRTSVTGTEATDVLDAAQAELEAARAELRRYQTDTAATRLAALDPEAYEQGQEARLDVVEAAQRAVEAARTATRQPDLPDDLADTWDTHEPEAQRTYLADAFAVIAVAPVKPRTPRSMDDTVRAWAHGEDGCPTGLPGFEGGDKVTPITMG